MLIRDEIENQHAELCYNKKDFKNITIPKYHVFSKKILNDCLFIIKPLLEDIELIDLLQYVSLSYLIFFEEEKEQHFFSPFDASILEQELKKMNVQQYYNYLFYIKPMTLKEMEFISFTFYAVHCFNQVGQTTGFVYYKNSSLEQCLHKHLNKTTDLFEEKDEDADDCDAYIFEFDSGITNIFPGKVAAFTLLQLEKIIPLLNKEIV